MSGYRLSSEAIADLTEIRNYLADAVGPRVTRYILSEIRKALRFLSSTPGAGHGREDLTDQPVKFWPVLSFLIVYDPGLRPIGVARVLHASRDVASLLRTPP